MPRWTQFKKAVSLNSKNIMFQHAFKRSISRHESESQRTAIVVGAGMAGIAATQKLVDFGHRVLLLEASDSLGGRIRNRRSKMGIDLPDGASWVHGRQSSILNSLKNLNVPTPAYNHHDFSALKFVKSTEENKEKFELESLMEMFSTENFESLPNSTEKEFVQRIKDCESMYSHGVPVDVIQATRSLYQQPNEGEDYFVGGGYQNLIHSMYKNALASGKVTTEFGAEVNLIDCQNQYSHVQTARRDYRSDAVICTVPLGVLQTDRVKFEGISSDSSKFKAFSTMQSAHQVKIFLEFDKPFWEENSDHLIILNQDSNFPAMTSYVNLFKFSNKKAPVLMFSVYADQMLGKNEKELMEMAIKPLQASYGKLPAVTGQIQDWRKEPFTIGSWSCPGRETTKDLLEGLHKPECNGRLFFAGEHIATPGLGMGTVHGAYESGISAAINLHKHLNTTARMKLR